jgi:CheY-like chemotaxis protein
MPKPILLIDDEEKFAQMLQELLHLSGFESDYCLNPKEAVARLRQEEFDLVITDYKMPEMDGAEFLQEARKLSPDLPVIMISGLMNMPELIKVANIGVTLVLEKPFKTEELLEYVARFVRTSPGDEASAHAMDMEASEINFQIEDVSVSYPSPASFLSDASNENKRFLEAIWNKANACRHLPFYAQRGGEVRLVAKELMDWTEQDPESEVVRIDLVDTKTDFTRSWVLECDPFPGVLMVDLREVTWNEETAGILAGWISFIETCGRDLSLSRILYVLPTGAAFSLDQIELPEEQKKLVSSECPVLLSLRERILDIATYLNRLFSPDERAAIGEAALLRLLHYSWPGGYQELASRVSAVKAHLTEHQQVTEEAVVAILSERCEDPASLKGSLDLEGYLKRRQREYIVMHRESGEDLKNTLLRLGIREKGIEADAILRDSELIYPELVN